MSTDKALMTKVDGDIEACGRGGFTMIEVIVACSILAVIAGVVTLSVRGRIGAARLVQARDQIAAIDRVARDMARSRGVSVALEFDLRDDEVRLLVGRKTQKVVKLSSSLASVRVGSERNDRLVISPLGQSATYAVELDREVKSSWLIVSGLSGQPFASNNLEQINALLRL